MYDISEERNTKREFLKEFYFIIIQVYKHQFLCPSPSQKLLCVPKNNFHFE